MSFDQSPVTGEGQRVHSTRRDSRQREPRSRPRRRAVVVTGIVLLALGLLAAAFFGSRLLTGLYYELAYNAFTSTSAASRPQREAVETAVRLGTGLRDRVGPVVGNPHAPDFVEPFQALSTSHADLVRALETAAPAPTPGPSSFDPPPLLVEQPWPWQIAGEASRIAESTDQLRTALERDRATAAALNAAIDPVASADQALFAAAAAQARDVVERSPSATHRSRVELDDSVVAAEGTMTSQHTSDLLDRISAGMTAVTESHAAEEARRADPDNAVRIEIEEYARSIANGIPIDFAWAPIVAGVGADYLSGTAEWEQQERWTLITLNYTIDDAWSGFDSFDARALVTHEVGHVQATRDVCEPVFADAVFEGDHEVWATSWAISMGFDTDGSSIEAYGRPTDAQIARAADCR